DFADMGLLGDSWVLLRDDAHDVVFAHHEVLGAFDFHRLAGEFAEQDAVADLDVERADIAVLENAAIADGDDLALVGLLGGVVGNDDAAGGLMLLVEALHHDAVVQRTDAHHCLARFRIHWLTAAVFAGWPPIDTPKLIFSSLNGDGMYESSRRISFSFFAFSAAAGKSKSMDWVASWPGSSRSGAL